MTVQVKSGPWSFFAISSAASTESAFSAKTRADETMFIEETRTSFLSSAIRDAMSAAVTKILNGTDPNTAIAEAQKTVEFAMK